MELHDRQEEGEASEWPSARSFRCCKEDCWPGTGRAVSLCVCVKVQTAVPEVEPVLTHDDDGTWAVEEVETRAEPVVSTALKVNAVEAHVVESRKDKSWGTMRRLDEEQRRGILEMREREERMRQELLEGGTVSPSDGTSGLPASSEKEKEKTEAALPASETPAKKEETGGQQQQNAEPGAKRWVSMRLLQMKASEESTLGSAGGGRRGRQAAPNFEADPDLATAAQIAALKPVKKAGRKACTQQTTVDRGESPAEAPVDEDAGRDPAAESAEEAEEVSAKALFDFFKFVDLRSLHFSKEPQDDERVRAKYAMRHKFTPPTAA